MAKEKVRGDDLVPEATVNAADLMAGTYKVTAEGGVYVSGGFHAKGDEVELGGDAARALLNEGSIERA